MDVPRICIAVLLGSAGFYVFVSATLALIRTVHTAVLDYAARLLRQDHGVDTHGSVK